MPVSETQIQLYALTKQLMDLSEKYILTISSYEKAVILEKINILYEELDNLGLQYKDENK